MRHHEKYNRIPSLSTLRHTAVFKFSIQIRNRSCMELIGLFTLPPTEIFESINSSSFYLNKLFRSTFKNDVCIYSYFSSKIKGS